MSSTRITETTWNPEERLMVTHISGELEISDIETWENSFKNVLSDLEDNTVLKIFVNMYGFKAVDINAHKKFRGIIPLTLADYGWKVGYLGLFEEESKYIDIKNIRGIKCMGAAHSHHDTSKMNLYESKFSSIAEHFFSDPVQAEIWINNLEILK